MNLAGIDIGTSGVKCAVFDENGEMLTYARREYTYVNIHEGYCLDGNQIWQKTKEVLKEVAISCKGEISGLAVSALGEACVLLDSNNQVMGSSILYNDKRGMQESAKFISEFGKDKIFEKSGVSSNGTYSLEKLMWIKDHESYYKQVDKIFLFEDFITFMLTGERQISFSLAARTMGLDFLNRTWWNEIFSFAGIDIRKMSVLNGSARPVGNVRKILADELGLKTSVVVFTGGHDHSCCAFGAGMIDPTISINISGSGDTISYLLEHPLKSKVMQDGGYCNTPYVLDHYYTTYGLCAMSGTMLRWFKDTLWSGNKSDFYAVVEKEVGKHITEILVLPAFSASGTPDFSLDTRGSIEGLTLSTTSIELYRALMESIAFHLKMNRQILGRQYLLTRVVGGGSISDAWNQMKADIFECEIQTIINKEAGTAGCAMLAGLGLGVFKNEAEAAEAFVHVQNIYYPRQNIQPFYKEKYQRFLDLYRRNVKDLEEKKC